MEELYELVNRMRAKLPAGRVHVDLDYNPYNRAYMLRLQTRDKFGQSLLIQQHISEDLFGMWSSEATEHVCRELQYHIDSAKLQVLESTIDLSNIFVNSLES